MIAKKLFNSALKNKNDRVGPFNLSLEILAFQFKYKGNVAGLLLYISYFDSLVICLKTYFVPHKKYK